jgi:hypothetical protein
MFEQGDKVIIKNLDCLLKDNLLKEAPDLEGVYCNKDMKYVLFSDFPYFGNVAVIEDVDKNDPDIPYFLSIGIWVPEFMIISYDEVVPNPEPKAIPVEDNIDQKVYINKFNNKPFGKVFLKLIALDKKVAEFSATQFSKLKKHELQYIAKLLQDHGAEFADYNKLTQKELAVYCYNKALEL